MTVREAGFALRVVERRTGQAGIVYRRSLDDQRQERLTRVAAISPLAFTAGTPLLRAAVRAQAGPRASLSTGAYHPLDPDWGARVACYALVAQGLRNGRRLSKAADYLRHLDGTEAAWWLARMTNGSGARPVRALRILAEAVR